MSIRILPSNHLLLVENGLQEFDDEGSCLIIVDDHAAAADQPEPRLISIALPKVDDSGIERELERWAPRIREHSLSDAWEAMREVLQAGGMPELTVDKLLEDARAIAEQEKVPAGWTAWGAIPRGSLSTLGEGTWLLIWPEVDARGRDLAYLVGAGEPTSSRRAVRGPEYTFRPDQPGFVRVARTGLTAAQIDAFLAADHPASFDPEAELARMFPAEAA